MTTAILFGVSCGLLYIAVTFWIQARRLRALCRRCAEHMSDEHHTGLKDPKTNAALIGECEREGWTNGGKER